MVVVADENINEGISEEGTLFVIITFEYIRKKCHEKASCCEE